MSDQEKTQDPDTEIPIPSVNVQVAAAAIIAALWMRSVNRKLKLIAESQIALIEGVKYINEGIELGFAALDNDAVTVREVVRLASITESKGA